ncbi:MAG: 1,4-dihydroxy-2-naphthoyl-CoA synthase [Candidatus Azotimanducaceae bacterium]|jgi:1,4-dihydroxy-2-naphthoyl-CoA synthase
MVPPLEWVLNSRLSVTFVYAVILLGSPGISHIEASYQTRERVVGYRQNSLVQRAMKLIYTGDVLSAQEALDMGYIDELVPSAEIQERAHALASRIAKNSTFFQ